MKRLFLLVAFAMQMLYMNALNVERIEPTNWFVGMKNTKLQLMVYGKGIGQSKFKVEYPGVKIDSIVRLDSPNYLLIYLDLSGAKAGKMELNFSGKKFVYNLLEREMTGDKRYGFTNADVLYMLMPDRFASSNSQRGYIKGLNEYKIDRSEPSLRHGGDLEGIRQHLNYFNELGVTALWFTPVLENNSPDNGITSTYHGYATTNYYRIDPRFGTNDEYCRLVDEAHEHGLKVVMDMIFNHCGYDHPWVKDVPTKDWFNTAEWMAAEDKDTGKTLYKQTSYKLTPIIDPYASIIDKAETVEGWFVPTMPDLNQKNIHVITYLKQNSFWWIETAGIDGIRMDTYPYADATAMSNWMKELNNEYPNFNVVGETWVTEPAYTATWQKGSKLTSLDSNLKTVMDFSFYDKINMAKNEETDDWWKGFNRIYNSLVYDYLYENPSNVMAFIDNHDTDRFLGNGQNVASLKQALALLLTIKRIPQLYYGTEILMNGTKEITDGNVRKDFPGGFNDNKANAFIHDGRTKEQNEMFNWLSRLLHWRQGNEVITKGKQTQFIPYKGVYVVARQYKGKTVLTILNGTDEQREMPIKRYAEVIGKTMSAVNVITKESVKLSSDIKLAPRETLVIEF